MIERRSVSRVVRLSSLALLGIVAGCELVFPTGDLASEAGDTGGAGTSFGVGGASAGTGGVGGVSGAGGVSGGSSGAGGEAAGGASAGFPGDAGGGGNGVAGFPAAECQAGQTMDVGACAMCGTLRRHCVNFHFVAPVCEAQGVCITGAKESAPCGNCGTKSRTCNAKCAWDPFGACGSEGTCAPGSTTPGSCDPCSEQTCSATCTWGACALKPGNQCEWQKGTNHQCCGGNSWQFCAPPDASKPCHWYACASCSGCGC